MERTGLGFGGGEVAEAEYEDEWDYYSEDEDNGKKEGSFQPGFVENTSVSVLNI